MKKMPKRKVKLEKRINTIFGSQIAFAYALDENETLVSKIINGWRIPSKDRRLKWAKALKCKESDIF